MSVIGNALVVDDTPANRDFLERLLKQARFDIHGASTGKEATEHIERLDKLALAVVDMELPDASGLQITAQIRSRFPKAYIVVATMHDERSLMQEVFRVGGNCFLVKPHGFMDLFRKLTTNSIDQLRDGDCTVIDQYGPRAFSMPSTSSSGAG
ncbi:MAG: response regulator [Anaerolineaceae bacterium]|nr:MAG: response regulator [Anaerolineaceae bacterium]